MKAIKMKKTSILLALLALELLGAPTLVQAQGAYDYESFNYPGSTFDQVFGINNRGDVVGIGRIDPDFYPYVYDSKKGGFTNVTPVAGFDATAVLGIADNGVLVGSVRYFDPVPSLDEVSGLIIDQNGAFTLFDHPDALLFTQARGVNNKGLVTGIRDRLFPLFNTTTLVAFVYDPKRNTFTDIIPEDDHVQSFAQGINSKGEVVGSAFFLDADDPCNPGNIGLVRYGWLRAKDGSVTYFQINGDRTAARGINDSGTIAGFVNDSGSGLTKGFVVVLDGSQCQSFTIADADLLHFPGSSGTFVGGIKNSGEVVGGYDDATPGLGYGFIAWPQ